MNVYTRVRRTAMYSWPGSAMRNLPLCTPGIGDGHVPCIDDLHAPVFARRLYEIAEARAAEAVVVNLIAGDGDHLVRHGDGLIKCAGALL